MEADAATDCRPLPPLECAIFESTFEPVFRAGGAALAAWSWWWGRDDSVFSRPQMGAEGCDSYNSPGPVTGSAAVRRSPVELKGKLQTQRASHAAAAYG